jgi:hypothetical protein
VVERSKESGGARQNRGGGTAVSPDGGGGGTMQWRDGGVAVRKGSSKFLRATVP